MDVSMDCFALSSFPAKVPRLQFKTSDVGPAIHEVPLQWFKDHFLPPLPPEFELRDAIAALKENKTIKDDIWDAFSEPPSARGAHEDKVLAPFATIVKVVDEEAGKHSSGEPAVVFECNPNRIPVSAFRKSTSKPDGYGVYLRHDNYTADGPIFWEFIVAPGEKKRARLEDINDNISKILWSFNHTMREDPCRRFVIGYTIEDTVMRLWFCS
ncbi:hypothetical protein BDW22DRAFT_1417900 [Trametopsis cervina]|nr:hypothetical protein BDW22DRAFT_1417900 [Trametopsis cervina]